MVPRHPLQRRLGVLRVHLPPDDSRRRHVLQPTRQRDPLGRGRHLSGGERLPPELERLHPADHALELELPEGTQDVGASAPRHRLDQARQEDLTGLGAGAQTGGLDHRIPEAVLPLPRDLTRAQAHAHRQPVRSASTRQLDLLLHGHGAAQGARGSREGRHDPVAETLDLGPAALGKHPSQDGEVIPPQLVGSLGGAGVRQFRRTDEVGEQDGRTLGRRHFPSSGRMLLAPKSTPGLPKAATGTRARRPRRSTKPAGRPPGTSLKSRKGRPGRIPLPVRPGPTVQARQCRPVSPGVHCRTVSAAGSACCCCRPQSRGHCCRASARSRRGRQRRRGSGSGWPPGSRRGSSPRRCRHRR